MKISKIFSKEKIVILIKKYKNSPLAIIISAIITIIPFLDSTTDLIPKIKPWFSQNKDLPAPIFTKRSKGDSVNILVSRFDNLFRTSPNNCVGYMLAYRIRHLKYIKKLPINVQYVDSINSPYEYKDAQNILTKHNADIIIYGLYENNTMMCDSGSFCFKAARSNFMQQAYDTNNIKIDRDKDEFKPFKTDDLQKGLLTLDSIYFDRWIQGLYILKRRNDLYDKYVAFNIDSKLSNKLKAEAYLKRSELSELIGDYYDAIADVDSSISFIAADLDSLQESKFSRKKTFAEHLSDVVEYSSYNSQVIALKQLKYKYYWLFNEPDKAILLIDKDIKKIKDGLKDPAEIFSSHSGSLDQSKDYKNQDNNPNKPRSYKKNKGNASLKEEMDAIFENMPKVKISMYYGKEILDLTAIKALIFASDSSNEFSIKKASKYLNLSKNAQTKLYFAAGIILYHRKNNNKQVKYFYDQAAKVGIIEDELFQITNIPRPYRKIQLFQKELFVMEVGLIIIILFLIFLSRYNNVTSFRKKTDMYIKKNF